MILNVKNIKEVYSKEMPKFKIRVSGYSSKLSVRVIQGFFSKFTDTKFNLCSPQSNQNKRSPKIAKLRYCLLIFKDKQAVNDILRSSTYKIGQEIVYVSLYHEKKHRKRQKALTTNPKDHPQNQATGYFSAQPTKNTKKILKNFKGAYWIMCPFLPHWAQNNKIEAQLMEKLPNLLNPQIFILTKNQLLEQKKEFLHRSIGIHEQVIYLKGKIRMMPNLLGEKFGLIYSRNFGLMRDLVGSQMRLLGGQWIDLVESIPLEIQRNRTASKNCLEFQIPEDTLQQANEPIEEYGYEMNRQQAVQARGLYFVALDRRLEGNRQKKLTREIDWNGGKKSPLRRILRISHSFWHGYENLRFNKIEIDGCGDRGYKLNSINLSF